jgi:hypothetical protein
LSAALRALDLVLSGATTEKFRFGASSCPAKRGAGGVAVRRFWVPGFVPGRKRCGLWKCESGSGASLGAPRSAKSDRMCGCSDASASETAALCVQRRCENAEYREGMFTEDGLGGRFALCSMGGWIGD